MLDPSLDNTIWVEFNTEIDQIKWNWSKNGCYSASSVYQVLGGGGLIGWHFNFLWKCKLPPTVKIFAYMLLQGRILTRDVLIKRRMRVDRNCVLCTNCPVESQLHLIFLCPVAVHVWFKVSALIRRTIFKCAGSVQGVLENSWELVRLQGGMSHKK